MSARQYCSEARSPVGSLDFSPNTSFTWDRCGYLLPEAETTAAVNLNVVATVGVTSLPPTLTG